MRLRKRRRWCGAEGFDARMGQRGGLCRRRHDTVPTMVANSGDEHRSVRAVPNSDYWAALSQVLPVFALAVVIEARLVAREWNTQTPRWTRFTQSFIWFMTLLVLAFGESAALRALRGEEIWRYWALVMDNAVGAAIGLLILAPALEFLTKGNAEGVARILTGGWIPRLRLALLDRKYGRLHRNFFKIRQASWRRLARLEDLNTQYVGLVDQLKSAATPSRGTPFEKEVDKQLHEVIRAQEEVVRAEAAERVTYRRLVREELERERKIRVDRVTRKHRLAEARVVERHRVLREILADTADFGTAKSSLANREASLESPDDGGFLPLLDDAGDRTVPVSTVSGNR